MKCHTKMIFWWWWSRWINIWNFCGLIYRQFFSRQFAAIKIITRLSHDKKNLIYFVYDVVFLFEKFFLSCILIYIICFTYFIVFFFSFCWRLLVTISMTIGMFSLYTIPIFRQLFFCFYNKLFHIYININIFSISILIICCY